MPRHLKIGPLEKIFTRVLLVYPGYPGKLLYISGCYIITISTWVHLYFQQTICLLTLLYLSRRNCAFFFRFPSSQLIRFSRLLRYKSIFNRNGSSLHWFRKFIIFHSVYDRLKYSCVVIIYQEDYKLRVLSHF